MLMSHRDKYCALLNHFNVCCPLRGHTYLNKPADFSHKFV